MKKEVMTDPEIEEVMHLSLSQIFVLCHGNMDDVRLVLNRAITNGVKEGQMNSSLNLNRALKERVN